MEFNIHYKLGLRAIKTAISVFFCVLIGFIWGNNDAFYSSIASVICLQQTYNKTLIKGYNRFLGTALGGIIGYILLEVSQFIPLYNKGINLIIIPLAVLFAIYFCNTINKQDAISICCIVILSIVAKPDKTIDNTLIYVFTRVINTSIGVLVAILVDRFIFPKKDNKLIK